MSDTPIKTIIKHRLMDKFAPDFLHVADVSWQHKGHAGARPSGQTHFEIEISAAALTPPDHLPDRPLNKIDAHRAIYAVLTDLMQNPIHALQIKLKR